MLTLRSLDLEECDWDQMDAAPDRGVYQTREWLRFVAETQRAEPVVADVLDEGARPVGRFTGLIAKRWGVRVLGSPFPGWNSGPMGFNLFEHVDPRALGEALVAHAFGAWRCVHLELLDPAIGHDDISAVGLKFSPHRTYRLDLTRGEDEIFGGMSSACRRAIRKAGKNGVIVEEATGPGFADEHFAQLEDVFAKQSLKPNYDVERVRKLIDAMDGTGRLLLLRAVSPDSERIASGIFVGMNRVAFYWGGASWRAHQQLRPNEALMWHAIRHWKRLGVAELDLGGGTVEGFAEYKRKFGPHELTIDYVRCSRFRIIATARDAAAAATSLLLQRRPHSASRPRSTAG
jgi:hypothetical protein